MNAIVGQSGGPTAVINSSLAGVYESCKVRGAKNVYGMLNGISGLLEKRFVNLSDFCLLSIVGCNITIAFEYESVA